MNLVRGKIFGLTPCIPIFFKTSARWSCGEFDACFGSLADILRGESHVRFASCRAEPRQCDPLSGLTIADVMLVIARITAQPTRNFKRSSVLDGVISRISGL